MKSPAHVLITLGVLLPFLAYSKDDQVETHGGRISFYKVELVCNAAPNIGCGSAAKPVLIELEREPLVREAWLNRSGTVVALVWKQRVSGRTGQKLMAAVLEQKKIREIKGEARVQTLKKFQAGKGWYRGVDVDRLSEEEAEIIAGRLVRQMQKLITIADEKGRLLQQQFSRVLGGKLTQGESEQQTEAALVKICREHLSEKDVAIIVESHQRGAFSDFRNE